MGTISLQIPEIGQADTTEDVKVANNFTALETVINGNIDDTNLSAPNNGTYKSLLEAAGTFVGGETYAPTGSDFFFSSNGSAFPNGGVNSGAFPLWWMSSANHWTVTNKTAQAVVRMAVITNGVAPGCNFAGSLYSVTSGGGTGNVTVNLSLVGSFTTIVTAPGVSGVNLVESSAFALPSSANVAYALGCRLTSGSGTLVSTSVTYVSCQLFVFNS